MLGGGDQHALPHETGGIAYFGHIASVGGNLKVVQISAAEDDSRAGRRWQQAQRHRRAGVQTNSTELQRRGNRLFQVSGIRQRALLAR